MKIEIAWQWLPLIITIVLIILTWMLSGFSDDSWGNPLSIMFAFLTLLSMIISLLIYVCLGFAWIINHVTIT